MRNVAKLLVALTMLASGTAANAAAVIYDNGITATNGFVSDTDFPMFVADDFKLNPGANVITDVHWTGLYAFTGTPQEDAFTIQFFADAGGSPALAPFLSLSVSPSRTDTGNDTAFGADIFAYDVVIAPLALAPNTTFWLSIFNDTTADTDDNWFWGMVDNGGNSFNRASPGAWSTQGNGQEFQLTGVPQPSALALFAVGIFGLAVYVRRKRSKGSAPISVHA